MSKFSIENQRNEMQVRHDQCIAAARVVAKCGELQFTEAQVDALASVINCECDAYPDLLDLDKVDNYVSAFFWEGGQPYNEPAYACLSAAVTAVSQLV